MQSPVRQLFLFLFLFSTWQPVLEYVTFHSSFQLFFFSHALLPFMSMQLTVTLLSTPTLFSFIHIPNPSLLSLPSFSGISLSLSTVRFPPLPKKTLLLASFTPTIPPWKAFRLFSPNQNRSPCRSCLMLLLSGLIGMSNFKQLTLTSSWDLIQQTPMGLGTNHILAVEQ